MMLKKWTKVMLLGASVLALTGCKTTSKDTDQSALNSSGSHYTRHHTESTEPPAEASGLGAQSTFNGQTSSNAATHALTTAAANRIYYFDFDKDMVHDEYKPAILAHANYLVAHRDTKILVEGHTDPRGSREYNIGLGERRANSVVSMLTQNGVSPTQIRVVSYGSEKLAAPGHSEDEFQKDRRAVLVFAQN